MFVLQLPASYSCTRTTALIIIVTATLSLMSATPALVSASGIDCFKCVSVNGSNPACEDPFHNNYTWELLERPCMGGRKGRNGLFPASACIKMSGSYADGSGTIMIRGCALDSGTLTTDTEIIRMSHCGSFYYDDKYVHGCVQSCDDVDACNGSPPRLTTGFYANRPTVLLTTAIVLFQPWQTIT